MNESHLRDLIEEATVDCYDEYEQFWGFYTALDEGLHFPFEAKVLGDTVKVTGVSDRSGERRGMMIEIEKKGQTYAFPLTELGVSDMDEESAAWISAYQLWSQ